MESQESIIPHPDMYEKKIGCYDWITDYTPVRCFIEESLGKSPFQSSEGLCLVLGCGTSSLSKALAEEVAWGVKSVVSTDIDRGCIQHMTQLHRDDDRLVWVECDMLDAEAIAAHCKNGTMPRSYDLILDKGTFDAILVEGCAYNYLNNVYNLILPGAFLCLVSLHSEEFLAPLLTSPVLNFDVNFSSPGRLLGNGCIALCRKRSDVVLDLDAIRVLEESVMDNYFKEQMPLITPQGEGELRFKFGDIALPLNDAYYALFGDKPLLGYSQALFFEDLSNFQLANEGYMDIHEALSFVKAME